MPFQDPVTAISQHVLIETESGTAYEVEPCMGIYVITRLAPTRDTSDEKVAGSWKRTASDAYTVDEAYGGTFHAYGGTVDGLNSTPIVFLAQVL